MYKIIIKLSIKHTEQIVLTRRRFKNYKASVSGRHGIHRVDLSGWTNGSQVEKKGWFAPSYN